MEDSMRVLTLLPLALMLVACAPPPPRGDLDTGVVDTDDTDIGDTDTDTGDTDTGDTDVPLGVDLFGPGPFDCDALTLNDVAGTAPSIRLAPVIVDGAPERSTLSQGGQRIFDEGNLGGSSLNSEILAYEVLTRCDGALLVYTEGEIPYEDAGGKKTDLVVTLDDLRIGVSVTRAVSFPADDPYPVDKALDLLTKKLGDIPLSTDNAVDVEVWFKQVLFVAAYADEHADSLQAAWDSLDAGTRGDTVVLISVTHGDDDLYYFE